MNVFIIKIIVGIASKSNSMIADSFNSAGDIFASFMTWIGNHISSVPNDDDHQVGHGKAEYIFSMIISISMMLIALKLLYDSFFSLINHDVVVFSINLIIVCIITIVTKLCLFLYAYRSYQKYDNLKREYNELRKAGFSPTALESLRRELKEKEEKINQLSGSMKVNSYSYQNNDLRATYNELKSENYDLKNQLNMYETQYNNQNNVIYLDNDFNDIRNSITQNNKAGFNQAIDRLKTNLDNYTQDNYNTIIMMKDREIEKWKEEDRQRREREKQQFSDLINSYDQTLSMEERENQQLKMRLKELEGFFG